MKPLRVLRFGTRSVLRRMKIGSVNLVLTRRCNVRCKYCRAVERGNGVKLTIGEWEKIISNFSRRHFIFTFTGGEPLLYDGVSDLIDYASRKGITALLTNGLIVSEQHLRRFRKLDYLGLSFDEINRSDVSLKSASDKLKVICEYSRRFGFTVEVSTTITSKNVDQVPLIVSEMNRLKFNSAPCLIQSSQGDWWQRNTAPDLEFRSEEDFALLERLQQELVRMKKAGYRLSNSDGYFLGMSNYLRGAEKIRCLAAENYFVINNDGFIMACQDIPPSEVNALDFKNYDAMKQEVKNSVPTGCRCWWECYHLYAFVDRHPLSFICSKILDGFRRCYRDWKRR